MLRVMLGRSGEAELEQRLLDPLRAQGAMHPEQREFYPLRLLGGCGGIHAQPSSSAS